MMRKFDLSYTKTVKGIALIMMLMHHLFNSLELVDKFVLLINSKEILLSISNCSKTCVSLFLIISGYGIFISYENGNENNTFKDNIIFSFLHVKKLLIEYWWALLPFMIFGCFTNIRTLIDAYNINIFSKLITDILGLNFLIYGYHNLYNITCWYISVALLFYLFHPILHKMIKKNVFIFIVFSLLFSLAPFPKFISRWSYYLLPYTFGMLLANNNILDFAVNKNSRSFYVVSFFLFLVFTYLRYMSANIVIETIYAFSIILITIIVKNKLKKVGDILEFIGKHSANIFMIHTFFYSYMFNGIVYLPKLPLLVLIWLLIICLVYSICLEKIKAITYRMMHK